MIGYSCKKTSVLSNDGVSSFDDVFETFYLKMSSNYVYWDIDKTNLDSLYIVYKPRFHALDIAGQDDRKKSVAYFRAITSTLIDSHFQINFLDQSLKDSLIYPALVRKKNTPSFHNRYDFGALSKKYLDSGFVSSSYFYQDSGESQLLYSIIGTISRKIIYFSCNQFAFNRAIKNKDTGTIAVLDRLDNELQNVSDATKGIIIDLRGNGGGDVADLSLIFGRFITEQLKIGSLKYKNGDGRFDYTPAVNSMILPYSSSNRKLSVPLVLLVDDYSASLSEAFTAGVRALPNGRVIGETTWGATGPLADNSVYNYGGFQIGDFMRISTAIGQFTALDGKSHEMIGFNPDITIPFDLKSYQANIDNQLVGCINLILSGLNF